MSRKLSDLNKRLAKVEQQAADLAMRDKLGKCNCYPKNPVRRSLPWFVTDSNELEAAMNLPCPAHGFRRLGKLMAVRIVGPKGEISEECSRRSTLVKEYYRRLSDYLKSHPELENDI